MGQAIRCGALTLALLSAAPVGRAQAIDCWLLDGGMLAQARTQGRCLDAFARDSRDMAAAPTTQKLERRPKAPKASPEVAGSTSWGAPMEEERNTLDAEVADTAANALEYRPPPAGSPIANLLSDMDHDFRYFVYDLRRDFSAIARALRGTGMPPPNPAEPRWDR